jgi:hypothetical protein
MMTMDNKMENKKLIIGLGCSWTQGEGGYTEETWKKYNGKINLPMHHSIHLIPMEWENSWVNVLCKNYLTDYTPVNLGQRGIGNRGAAKSLYLTNIDFDKVDDAIVVFMLSGYERFDFFRQDFCVSEKKENPYKIANQYNFQTLWPNNSTKLWDIFAREVWSEEMSAIETLCSILEVQTFCKAHGFKFVLANAFDYRGKQTFIDVCKEIANQVDWSCYLHDSTNYNTIIEYLVEKDDWLKGDEKNNWWGRYQDLKYPKKYLTNCIHPTIEGYKLIADELYKFIKEKYKLN